MNYYFDPDKLIPRGVWHDNICDYEDFYAKPIHKAFVEYLETVQVGELTLSAGSNRTIRVKVSLDELLSQPAVKLFEPNIPDFANFTVQRYIDKKAYTVPEYFSLPFTFRVSLYGLRLNLCLLKLCPHYLHDWNAGIVPRTSWPVSLEAAKELTRPRAAVNLTQFNEACRSENMAYFGISKENLHVISVVDYNLRADQADVPLHFPSWMLS